MRPQHVIAVLLAIVAAIVVLTATQQGIGVSPDSVAYLSTADSIAAGRGAMTITSDGWRPLTHFPPLYPLVLAIGSARAVHVLLFALFIAAACLLAFQGSGHSLAAAILTGAVLLASREVVHAFLMAWSEPLFFVLLFAFFALLGRAGVPPARLLVAAGLIAAAATLTRYAGISVIATGAVALLLFYPWQRWRNAAIFSIVAILPVGAWLLRNALVGDSATARPLLFHPMPFGAYLVGAENVWRFLMRGWEGLGVLERIPRNLHALAGALVAAFFIAAGLKTREPLPRLLALFALLYIVVFAAVGAFLDAVVFDERLLLPFTVSVAVLAVVLLVRWTSGERRRSARVVLLALFALHLAASARVVVAHVAEARREGLEFNSRAWKRSPLIARVEQLPARRRLCSNAEDVIWFQTGRTPSTLPWKYSPVTTLANPRYGAEINTVAARCDVIVWFSTVSWRSYLPSREELLAQPRLTEVAREDDGSIFAGYTPSP